MKNLWGFAGILFGLMLAFTACNSPLPSTEKSQETTSQDGQQKEGLSPDETIQQDTSDGSTQNEPSPEPTTEPDAGSEPTQEPSPEPSREVVPEDGGSDEVPDKTTVAAWTWGRCRSAWITRRLSPPQQAMCDRLHTKEPKTFEYGLRYYILNQTPDPKWEKNAKTTVAGVNKLLLGAGLKFRVVGVHVLTGLKLDGQDGNKYTIAQIAGDMAKYLNLQTTDSNKVFQALKAKLADAGVSASLLNQLKETTPRTLGNWFLLLSRTDPEHIPVFVVKKFSRAGVAGLATGSITSAIGASGQSHVQVKSITAGPVLAHELGHIFGLGHTHVQKIGAEMSNPTALVDFAAMTKVTNGRDPVKILQQRLGSDFKKTFKAPYFPYNTPTTNVNNSIFYFEALKKLWQWPRMTYKEGYQSFAGMADFINWGKSKKKIYYKNFVRNPATGQTLDWKGNNCRYDARLKRVRCRYESPSKFQEGNASFLDAGICFQKGTGSNLMSYITPPVINGVRNKGHLSKEQIDLIHLGRFLPARLLLRNYAQK